MRSPDPPELRLQLGGTVATPGGIEELTVPEMRNSLRRHERGDLGDVDEEDKQANEAALRDGGRVLSAYRSARGKKFWIIKEWDRPATTIFLPSEYCDREALTGMGTLFPQPHHLDPTPFLPSSRWRPDGRAVTKMSQLRRARAFASTRCCMVRAARRRNLLSTRGGSPWPSSFDVVDTSDY